MATKKIPNAARAGARKAIRSIQEKLADRKISFRSVVMTISHELMEAPGFTYITQEHTGYMQLVITIDLHRKPLRTRR